MIKMMEKMMKQQTAVSENGKLETASSARRVQSCGDDCDDPVDPYLESYMNTAEYGRKVRTEPREQSPREIESHLKSALKISAPKLHNPPKSQAHGSKSRPQPIELDLTVENTLSDLKDPPFLRLKKSPILPKSMMPKIHAVA